MRRLIPRPRFGVTATLFMACAAVPVAHAAPPPRVGAQAPEFNAINFVTGEKIRLSEQRGKPVVLTFWATWCPPCKKELPILEALQRKLARDKLLVCAISFHENNESYAYLKKVAKEQGWSISLLDDPYGSIARHYGIESVPRLFIIGADGTIRAVHAGYGETSMDELIDDLNAAFRAGAGNGQVPRGATPD
ncbi:MAG TPA: TlpA disulfide reductase family protein [Candidatus Dormibacteraeota bacterium]|nr:TlpA disulfide reductase family protein [Candidatus Dormibacteraeota bacterium]